MKASEFYCAFVNAMKESNVYEGHSYLEIYRDNTAFTELVNKQVIHDIIANSEAHISVQHEYFRVDTVGWTSHYEDMESDAKDSRIKLNAHLWDLKIVVEHENSVTDWTDEIIKLIHIKCPVKVVIGYNYCDQRDQDEEKLDFVAKWMKEIDSFSIGAEKEEYLVILGNTYNPSTKANYDSFDYRGYLYDFDKAVFEQL